MKHFTYIALSIALLCLDLAYGNAVTAQASSIATASGPHGGHLLQDGDYQFEVRVDNQTHLVQVYSAALHSKPPQAMELTLLQNNNSGQSIKLQALKPNPTENVLYYEGNLAPNRGSYIGLQLSFQTGLKAVKILKYIPILPDKVQ